jgi:hypothetical protein
LLKLCVFTGKNITSSGFHWKMGSKLRIAGLFTNITSAPHTPSLSQSLGYIPATTCLHVLLQSA